jgi:hypothetical protein
MIIFIICPLKKKQLSRAGFDHALHYKSIHHRAAFIQLVRVMLVRRITIVGTFWLVFV